MHNWILKHVYKKGFPFFWAVFLRVWLRSLKKEQIWTLKKTFWKNKKNTEFKSVEKVIKNCTVASKDHSLAGKYVFDLCSLTTQQRLNDPQHNLTDFTILEPAF